MELRDGPLPSPRLKLWSFDPLATSYCVSPSLMDTRTQPVETAWRSPGQFNVLCSIRLTSSQGAVYDNSAYWTDFKKMRRGPDSVGIATWFEIVAEKSIVFGEMPYLVNRTAGKVSENGKVDSSADCYKVLVAVQ